MPSAQGVPSSDLLNGRYELLDPLGQGGMGEVRRARDRLTGRDVAIKRVRTSKTSDEARLSLAREFALLSSLRHPNIVSVLDYGFEAGVPFLAMEIVEGGTDLLEVSRGASTEGRIEYLFQLLRALSYLHRRGIFHRDLKPSNVLVHDGSVTVLDFGISSGPESAPGSSGTPDYIAPEILAGGAPSPASDLYAVGVMAYEMFAGSHPFASTGMAALIYQVLEKRPSLARLGVTPRLANVVGRALAKRPEERFAKAADFLSALSEASGVPAPPESLVAREGSLRSARFVGRDRELGQMDQALADAEKGSGSTWLVLGDEGVGKSRLLAEIRSRALVGGARVLKGRAVANGPGPFSLFREPVRQLLLTGTVSDEEASALTPLLPDVETLLGRTLPEGTSFDPVTQLERLSAAVEALFGRITTPVVLQLEDVHLAHESVALIRAVNRIVRTLPLVVVCTWRRTDGSELPASFGEMQTISLSRLDTRQIARLAGSVLGEELSADDRLVTLLERETEGNALFVVEVLRALGEAAGSFERWDPSTVPDELAAGGIGEVLRQRLERLPASVRAPLAFAALVGRVVDLDVMRAAWPHEDLGAWLAACAETSVLEGSEYAWRFTHDRMREAVVADLDDRARVRLHRSVAEAIESVHGADPDWASRLAEQWKGAEEPGRAIPYLMQVSVRMLSSGAPGQATRHAVEALGLMGVDMPEDRHFLGIAIGKEMGEVYRLLGGRSPDDLVDLPELTDPAVAGVIQTLELVKPAAHMSHQLELFALAALKGMALTLEHGAGPYAPDVVATYAAVSRSMTGDVALAARFSDASMALDRRIHGRVRAACAFLRGWFIHHWKDSLTESVRLAEQGAADGFEHADVLYACFNAAAATIYLAYSGAPPAEVEAHARARAGEIRGAVKVSDFHCLLERQVARAFAGKTRSLTSFDDDEVDEKRDVASIRESGNYNQIGYFCASKARLHLCVEDCAEALRYAQIGEPLRASFQGQVADWELTFLRGLATLVRAHDLKGTQRSEHRRTGLEALGALRTYAKANAHTFAHKARLLEAEMAVLDGSPDEAAAGFREAADLAAASGFTQDRALALHRLAVSLRRSGREADARAAARSAAQVYEAWGAAAAAGFLLDRYDLRFGAASTG